MKRPIRRERRHLVTGLVIGGLIACSAWLAGAGMDAFRGGPTSIAVVDLDKVIRGLEEIAHDEGAVQARFESYKKEVDTLKEKHDQLEADLKALKEDDGGRRDKELELLFLGSEIEAKGKGYALVLELEDTDTLRRIYAKIVVTVTDIAARDGWDIVLLDDRLVIDIPDRGASPNELRGIIRGKKVLFAAQSVDITQAVIDKMNNEFVP